MSVDKLTVPTMSYNVTHQPRAEALSAPLILRCMYENWPVNILVAIVTAITVALRVARTGFWSPDNQLVWLCLPPHGIFLQQWRHARLDQH